MKPNPSRKWGRRRRRSKTSFRRFICSYFTFHSLFFDQRMKETKIMGKWRPWPGLVAKLITRSRSCAALMNGLLGAGGCLVVKGCVYGCECGCVCKSVGVRVFVSVRVCVCACWQQSYKLAKIVYVNFKFGILPYKSKTLTARPPGQAPGSAFSCYPVLKVFIYCIYIPISRRKRWLGADCKIWR